MTARAVGHARMPISPPCGVVGLVVNFVCVVAIAAPWLAGSGWGPSPSVQPFLFATLSVAALVAATGVRRLPGALFGGCVMFAAWAVWRGNGGLESYAVMATMVTVLAAASAGAALATRAQGPTLVASAVLLAAALSALIALGQYAGMAGESRWWMSHSPAGEAYANLRQRNQFATLTVMGTAAACWLAVVRGWRLPVTLLVVVLLALGNAATTSRIGLFELLLLAGVVACVPVAGRARLCAVAGVGVVAYAAGALALPALGGIGAASLFERVSAAGACSSRRVLWSNVLELVAQHPWLGWGWGELDFAHYAHLYAGPRFCDILDNAHNLPLHLAVELGVPFAALVTIAACVAVARLRPWRERDPTRLMAWAFIALIGAHSLVEYPLWYGPFQTALGLSLGVLYASVSVDGSARWRLPTAVLMLGMVAFAALSYWRVAQAYVPAQERADERMAAAVARVTGSWLFRDHARFAALTTTPLTRDNAAHVNAQARSLAHFSPEPRVVEALIGSHLLLGQVNQARVELARYRAAFPAASEEWAARVGAH